MGVHRRAPQENRVRCEETSPCHYGDREHEGCTRGGVCVEVGRTGVRHRHPALF